MNKMGRRAHLRRSPSPKIGFSFSGFVLESAGSPKRAFEKKKKEADSKTEILILGKSKG
jgi:hypothetical protein